MGTVFLRAIAGERAPCLHEYTFDGQLTANGIAARWKTCATRAVLPARLTHKDTKTATRNKHYERRIPDESKIFCKADLR